MKLYHFASAKYLIPSIREKRLKLSTFQNLNDPYEVMPIMYDKMGNFAQAGMVRQHIQNMLKDAGLLCMSSNVESSVMWGNYADRHKGVAYEFHFEQQANERLIHVTYDGGRVVFSEDMNLHDEKQLDDFFKILLGRKAGGWIYEAETRWVFPISRGKVKIMVDENGLIFTPLPEELKRIILGVDCPLFEDIVGRTVVEHGLNDISVTRARLSDRDFNIIVDPI